MGSDISDELRRFIAERAGHRCEYCLPHENDSYSPHQIDHIIVRKHGGLSTPENLAYACLRCKNAWKDSDIGSLDADTDQFVLLFNPRQEKWATHFMLQGLIIEPLTAEGRVTARLLRFNIDKRVVERRALMVAGRYPRE
ncbi:MAG: HNH endonuclease [Bryobacteraceae bacterium]